MLRVASVDITLNATSECYSCNTDKRAPVMIPLNDCFCKYR